VAKGFEGGENGWFWEIYPKIGRKTFGRPLDEAPTRTQNLQVCFANAARWFVL
jgi:hypothetical protein